MRTPEGDKAKCTECGKPLTHSESLKSWLEGSAGFDVLDLTIARIDEILAQYREKIKPRRSPCENCTEFTSNPRPGERNCCPKGDDWKDRSDR